MTDTTLTLAQNRLLLPSGLDLGALESTFGHLLGPGIDACARLNVFRPPQVASYLQEDFQELQS